MRDESWRQWVSALGISRRSCARFAFAPRADRKGARAGYCAQHRRSALRADSPAMLGLAAPSQNSLRALRALRSDNRDESEDNSRCARGREPCASRRRRCPPRPTRTRLHHRWTAFGHERKHRSDGAGGARRGRILWRREAQARGRRAQRALSTDSAQLSERSARRARSEFCAATPGRASQRSRRTAPTATACAHAGCRLLRDKKIDRRRSEMNHRSGPQANPVTAPPT